MNVMKPLFIMLMLVPSLAYAETFSHDLYDFKINYPGGWIVIEPAQNNQQVIVPIVTLLNRADPSFPTSVNIMAETVQNVTLSDYSGVNFFQIKEYFKSLGLVVHEQGNTTINDNPAFFIQYGWTAKSDNNATLQLVAKQYVLQKDNTFYMITYTQPQESRKVSLSQFEEIVSTFQFLDQNIIPDKFAKSPVQDSSKPQKGGCLIATASFGSELAPQVQMLRELRDNTLLNTSSGSAFMAGFNSIYYSFSPTVADWEMQNPVFKEIVKATITPLITTLSILKYVDIDSEAEMLTYGFGVILLNTGIYFGVPTFFILHLKKSYITKSNVHSKN